MVSPRAKSRPALRISSLSYMFPVNNLRLRCSLSLQEILREAHEACSSEVTKNQKGGEYVPGLSQALLQVKLGSMIHGLNHVPC